MSTINRIMVSLGNGYLLKLDIVAFTTLCYTVNSEKERSLVRTVEMILSGYGHTVAGSELLNELPMRGSGSCRRNKSSSHRRASINLEGDGSLQERRR